MHVVAISDLHGWLPPDVPACDLLIIAGDVCPDAPGSGSYAERHRVAPVQAAWLATQFVPWIERQRAGAIVMCWGNHDYVGTMPDLVPTLPAVVLTDESVRIAGVRIYGTPWTYYAPEMWAFDVRPAGLRAAMARISNDVEILITHGPPHGVLDLTLDGDRAGSRALVEAIPRLASLRLHVFGHIHEARGSQGVHHNVSVLDGRYRPYRLPVMECDV